MRRARNLVKYSLDCIQRYRTRTLVVLICLAISTALFSSVAFVKDGLVKEGALSLKYSPDITIQAISSGRQTTIDTSLIPQYRSAYAVVSVTPRIWGYGNIGNILIVVVGVDLNVLNAGQDAYPLESGSFLSKAAPNAIVIGKGLAEVTGAKAGSILTMITESVEERQYTVAGIFDSESSIYDADMVLMGMEAAADFLGVPSGQATDLAVDLISTQDRNVQVLAARGLSEFPNTRVLTKSVILDAQEVIYGDRSGFISLTWAFILISASIVAFNQTVVVGHESRFEVGLLKSLGFSTSDIIFIRLVESTIIGALAGSLGLAAAIVFDSFLNAPVIREFMLGWAVIYPGFQVPVHISAGTVLFAYAITIVPLLFATVIPAWLNATVDPDIAMRGAQA